MVLPYYENQRTLEACLQALADQVLPPAEVVVVDDGSAHPAAPIIEAFTAGRRLPFPVHSHCANHGGQSAATNVGIFAARHPITLMICADIIAHPLLVAAHARAHRESSEEVAVGGYLPYHPTVKMTPFMRFLVDTNIQFSFRSIEDPEDLPFLACYAPNFSARTKSLQAISGFDEAFVYGYQDTDLGKRLAYRGIRFVYRERAVGYHDHPTTLRAFVGRQHRVGEATLTWIEKWRDRSEWDKMRRVVAMYRPFVPTMEMALADTEKLETKLAARPLLWQGAKKRLYGLYTLLTHTALVAGVMADPARLQRTLGDGSFPNLGARQVGA